MARDAPAPLVFVDTNVLLDLYTAPGEVMPAAVAQLLAYDHHLISTFQIRHEFERNRMRVLERVLGQTEPPSAPRVPALFADVRTRNSLARQQATIERGVERVADRLQRALTDLRSDPVHKLVAPLWRDARHVLQQDHEASPDVLGRARARVERGDPPRKSGDYTMGDGINWEWCMDVCQQEDRDLLIVSRDKDFGSWLDEGAYLNTFLVSEFKRQVGSRRNARLTTQVTDALEALGADVSKGLKEAERKERASGRDGDGRRKRQG